MNQWYLWFPVWAITVNALLGQPARDTFAWRGHAHNDYLHPGPLGDALRHGFRSIEADIWLTNGALLVAHDFQHTSAEKTLENLYLRPLRTFVRTNATPQAMTPIILLVDVKSEAESTYAVLRQQLKDYGDILTRFASNRIVTNAVMVIISGNRATKTMSAESVRFAAVDGRLPDLDGNGPPALIPLVSDNWTKHFQWRGTGPFPTEEQAKLRRIVEQAHRQGRRIRFWAAPDREHGWGELLSADVDLINTDQLGGLQRFLQSWTENKPRTQ